jgi:predicted amidohydrolase
LIAMAGSPRFRAALVQLRSGRSLDDNINAAERLVREAAARGASYVQTPENTGLMELDRERLFNAASPTRVGPQLERLAALARELGIHLHIGSLAVALPAGKLANRSFLLGPDGRTLATYDKIHMFDVDLAGGESYRESSRFEAGGEAVVADTALGRIGLTICYDLRFPHLYRSLAHAGALIVAIPSAFTRQTGEAHWSVLMRARAIELGAFVLAAAQGGRHENGRETYGHSIAVAPWGEVLAEAGAEPGVVYADIDLAAVADARRRIPALAHDRPFSLLAAGHLRAAE